jgi:hypothetical protein
VNARLREEDHASEERLARVESDIKEARTDLHEFKLTVTKRFGEVDASIERLRGDMNAGFERLAGEMRAGFEKLRGEMNTGLANATLWTVLAAGSLILSVVSIVGRIFKLW